MKIQKNNNLLPKNTILRISYLFLVIYFIIFYFFCNENIAHQILTTFSNYKWLFILCWSIGLIIWGVVLISRKQISHKWLIWLNLAAIPLFGNAVIMENGYVIFLAILIFVLSAIFLAIKSEKSRCYVFYLFFGLLYIFLGQVEDYLTRDAGEDVYDCGGKPIIYLYPEQKTDVSVKAIYPEKFTHTYPHYINGWFVEANPNGDLVDKATGRNLYALYWEEKLPHKEVRPSEGFVVAGKDTIPFLEEKLAKLGLTEREADEFIIYWLPKLEDEKYNFIRFQTKAEQDTNMPLLIEPKPDTVIRVMMEYDDLDEPIKVQEQILPPTPVRTGFTVVEWGGTELDID